MSLGDWISAVVALATVFMAGATYYLAKVTKRLAEETTDTTKQVNRHHQENQRPFCVIAFYEASKQFPFGSTFEPVGCALAAISVCGELQNKGAGPAKDVFVYLNARRYEGEDGAFRLTRPVFVSGLVAAGEVVRIDVKITEDDIMNVWDGEKWSPTQVFDCIAREAYEIVLQYADIFGNAFRTVHLRGIFTNPIPNVEVPAVQKQMMIRPDRPSPIFLTGTQAVRTLADVPVPSLTVDMHDDNRSF